jgi:hypothetical protein
MFRPARATTLLLAALCVAAAARDSQAYYIYHDFPAGSSHTRVWSPETWLWSGENTTAAGQAVLAGQTSLLNAWRVTDSVASLPNPHYLTGLTTSAAADALSDGWRLATYGRYLDDFGGGPNMGLTVYLGQREYAFMLDLDGSGNLRATLLDETPVAYQLTSDGRGTAEFHNFALVGRGGSAAVGLEFDGVLVNADRSWDGRPLAHPDAVLWGNSNRAGSARGSMDFHYVVLEIGASGRSEGDFDVDGDVDGRDLIWWQRTWGSTSDVLSDANRDGVIDEADWTHWQRGFGTRVNASATLAEVPEPSANWLGLLAASAGCVRRRERA